VDLAVDISGRVKEFLREEILVDDASMELSDQTPLLKGLVDSLGLLQVVEFLEAEFQIEVDESDIIADNLGSIAQIETFVTRKSSLADA
jgi:acyl carrier protein